MVHDSSDQLQTQEDNDSIDDGGNNANEVRVSAALPRVDILDLDSILRQKSTLPNNNNSQNDDDDASTTMPFTIDNETLEQLHSCHTKCKRWIIFSDLHVIGDT